MSGGMNRGGAATTNLARVNLIAIPPPPERFSQLDWHLSLRETFRLADDQHQLADRIICEAERLLEESAEASVKNKKEVDHQLEVKIQDIEFVKEELAKQKREMDKEVEALETYRVRVMDAHSSLEVGALAIVQKCIVLRERRIGIDLCSDTVEIELRNEINVVEGAKGILVRLLEQMKEQIRRLKALIYTLVRDMEDKKNVTDIDRHNLSLTPTSSNLSIYYGSAPLNPGNITQEEWTSHTMKNIQDAQKELVSGRPLRAYVDVILKQVIEDLWKQYGICNEAFRRRIEEYKDVKAKLENRHCETVRQVNEMTQTIAKLEKGLAEKEGYMALAHTRLGNRCQRIGAELHKDEAETYLVDEVRQLKEMTEKIQLMLAEAHASLRYLMRKQVQLEEDINVKTNSIKIDEVECMTLRESINYHSY